LSEIDNQKTHLFGEMDLDLTKSRKDIVKDCYNIACQVGDYLKTSDFDNKTKLLEIFGSDLEKVKIYFIDEKVSRVERALNGENWEILDTKQKMFNVSDKTLQKYRKLIKFSTDKEGPMMQFSNINFLVNRYKIPAKKWGYHQDLLGIETKKQVMIWRDAGGHLEFLGLINKEDQT